MKTKLLSETTTSASFRDLQKFSLEFFEAIGSPISLSCYLLLKNKEYLQLVQRELNPLNYLTAWEFQQDYASVSLLKKYPGFDLGLDLEAEALEKFLWAEDQCRKTNEELNKREVLGGEDSSLTLSSVLYEASRYASRILGTLPHPSRLHMEFGPGASSSCKGRNISISDKLQSPIVVTRAALHLVDSHFSSHPWRIAGAVGIVPSGAFCYTSDALSLRDYNELAFVPKSSTSLRAICIEPNDMIYLQKGYGNYIRNKLRLAGLDISKQQSINAEFARRGSIDGTFATIDLKSASDTISDRILFEILPYEWYERLKNLTCQYTKLPDGRIIRNQKFSSMGNGFTFELETLIFFCIAKAVKRLKNVSGHVQVYGDDIICPTEMGACLVDSLKACGFIINESKTFLDGPFRESCGSDWFLGTNVRPIFQKKDICNVFEIYSLANSVRRLARSFAGVDGICDSRFYRCWLRLTRLVPADLRLYGPAYLGDIVFECNRAYRGQSCYEGGYIPVCTPVPERRALNTFSTPSQIGSLLLGVGEKFSIRGRITKYRVVKNRVSSSFWSWNDGVWSHMA